MKKLIQVLFAIVAPVLYAFTVPKLFYYMDMSFGDGDGLVTSRSLLDPYYIGLLLLLLLSLAILLKTILKVETKVYFFNIVLIFAVFYIVEYVLQKQDIFLKSDFDSNYFYSNRSFYDGFTEFKEMDDTVAYTWGIPIVKNSYGFRDKEINPDTNRVRIAFVGDSFCFGVGLDTAQRFSNRTIVKLNKDSSIYQGFNICEQGASTKASADNYSRVIDTIKPHITVLQFCLNDPKSTPETFSKEMEKANEESKGVNEFLGNFFTAIRLDYFGRLVSQGVNNYYQSKNNVPNHFDNMLRAYDPELEDWQEFEVALKRISEMNAKYSQYPPIFGTFNQVGSIDFKLNYSEHEQMLINTRLGWVVKASDAAKKAGFVVFGMEDVFDKMVDSGELTEATCVVHPLDGHPSAIMNEVYSDEIVKLVQSFK